MASRQKAATFFAPHLIIKKNQDDDYGYRQGTLADPFGHPWLIQKRLD